MEQYDLGLMPDRVGLVSGIRYLLSTTKEKTLVSTPQFFTSAPSTICLKR